MNMPVSWRLIASAATLLILSLGSAVHAEDHTRAFAPGEKLTFALRWGLIPAGSASMEVRPIKTVNGVPAYHFVMKARTNAFIDAIYRYRSRIDAYADRQMTRSIQYHKKTQLGRKTKEDKVIFDWKKDEVLFSRTKTEPGKTPEIKTEKKSTPLLKGTFDPLSVFYFTRQMEVGVGAPIERPVSDGRKCVVATAMILRRETVRLNGKDYDTYLVEPDLKHVGGVFEKSKDAKIHLWVTADERRIPVKIRSKVAVGYFTGELVSAESSGISVTGSLDDKAIQARPIN